MTTYEGKEQVATLDDLRELVARGDFHHATYRDHGKAHEGLAIYEKHAGGFQGYRHIGGFPGGPCATPEQRAICREAERIIAPHGTSVGSYGNG